MLPCPLDHLLLHRQCLPHIGTSIDDPDSDYGAPIHVGSQLDVVRRRKLPSAIFITLASGSVVEIRASLSLA